MAEIIFEHPGKADFSPCPDVRWLDADEMDVFVRHLEMCGQKPVDRALWQSIIAEGTIYCGLFVGGEMVARACVEKYSDARWEVADVRVVRAFRNRGYARRVCSFALGYVVRSGKIATIRTEEDNAAMRRVIDRLGFRVKTDA